MSTMMNEIPAVDGLTFEKNLSDELRKKCNNVYFDKEVKDKYGVMCWGVDIVGIHEDKIIMVQCKRSNTADGIKDVNHFIRGSLVIKEKEQKPCKLFWCCKTKPTKDGIESLNYDNVTIIEEDNQDVCINKSMIEICNFLGTNSDDLIIVDSNSSDEKPKKIKKGELSEEDQIKFNNLQKQIDDAKNNTYNILRNSNIRDKANENNLKLYISINKFDKFTKLYVKLLKKYGSFNNCYDNASWQLINNSNMIINLLNEQSKIKSTTIKPIPQLEEFDNFLIYRCRQSQQLTEKQFKKMRTIDDVNNIIHNRK
jgi:hypothetical protein